MTNTIKFEKITKDILDSFVLNSHEKIIYVILKSFEKAQLVDGRINQCQNFVYDVIQITFLW